MEGLGPVAVSHDIFKNFDLIPGDDIVTDELQIIISNGNQIHRTGLPS